MTTILLFFQIYNLFEGQMVRWLKPKIKKHDFLYLSSLVIVGSGLVTLLLFGLYCWYDTGKFPLLYGLPALNDGGESARFWIGSIYVPIFLAFAGIVVAHRLMNNAGNARLSPALNDDTVLQMVAESDSRTLENILDILSGSDAADIKYWGIYEANPAQAGWRADHPLRQPSNFNNMPYAPTQNYSSGLSSLLTPGVINDVTRDEGAGLMEKAASIPKGYEVDRLPYQPCANRDMTGTHAEDPGAGPIPCTTPQWAENIPAEPKEPGNEMDFIEQLKDPVNREKLVALLAGIEL
jgi:hypothetical protein